MLQDPSDHPVAMRPAARGRSYLRRHAARFALFLLCLAPAAALGWNAWRGRLGANPIEAVEHETGIWTLRLLAATLAITPLRRLTGWNQLVRHRRTLGLFTFFYATLHLAAYIGLDWFFDLRSIGRDIVQHPYITVGMAGFALLVPLALTSTKGWIRRLGGKRWAALHRLVYLVAICGVVHYLWAVKLDQRLPVVYAGIFAVLLGWRVAGWVRLRARRGPVPRPRRDR